MTRPKLASWLPVVTLLVVPPATFAADFYKIDPEHTSVIFSAAHTGLSYTYGMFRDVSGQYQIDKANPSNSRFQMVIRADSLDTNVAERDTHLRSADFFDVKQFPEITFDSTRCEFSDTPESGKAFRLLGTLTIHGVPRQVLTCYGSHRRGVGFGSRRSKKHRNSPHWAEHSAIRDSFDVAHDRLGSVPWPSTSP